MATLQKNSFAAFGSNEFDGISIYESDIDVEDKFRS
jgi:hypothetical protein